MVITLLMVCCISFDSYIKPQLVCCLGWCNVVVYLLIPTSNHNCVNLHRKFRRVVYLLIPTSNHNLGVVVPGVKGVVYLLIPTSNHNLA